MGTRVMRCSTTLLVVMIAFAPVACSQSTRLPTASKLPTLSKLPTASTPPAAPSPVATTFRAQPPLASDPAVLARDLSADEQALRDPSSSEAVLAAAAHRQQVAYRALGRHPEWGPTARAGIPPSLVETYDRNVDARRQLTALSGGEAKDTLPAWRIDPPARADALLGYYHEAEAATGVDWNYLAAINLVETGFGRIVGLSTAGAEGPMQFLPSTFAAYGGGGDIHSLHDSIMAAGRFLADSGFARDHDQAIFRYNNSGQYVRAVDDYAAVIASDPAGFAGYYRWDVYYNSTAGDVLLPVGYAETQGVPVGEYLASHPQ